MLNNKIFEEEGFNQSYQPFIYLRKSLKKQGYNLNTIDKYSDNQSIDIVICLRYEFNLKTIFELVKKNDRIKILVISTEELSVAKTQEKTFFLCGLFDRVLTWRDDDIDNTRFFKYFYMNPKRTIAQHDISKSKKLICMINSYKKNSERHKHNIYNERLKVIEYFDSNSSFSLYGFDWENYNKHLICYKGVIENKIDTYKKYSFAFAFENSNNEKGGISEKIFDIMSAGCIPIYYGAPNIQDLVPKNSFIDYRNFDSLEELNDFISNMNEFKKEEYRNAAKTFLLGNGYRKFNSEGFAETIHQNVKQLLSQDSIKKSILKIKLNLIKTLIKNRINPVKYRKLYFDILT